MASDLIGVYNCPDVARQQIYLALKIAQRRDAFYRQYGGKSSVIIKCMIEQKAALRNARMAIIDVS